MKMLNSALAKEQSRKLSTLCIFTRLESNFLQFPDFEDLRQVFVIPISFKVNFCVH